MAKKTMTVFAVEETPGVVTLPEKAKIRLRTELAEGLVGKIDSVVDSVMNSTALVTSMTFDVRDDLNVIVRAMERD